MSFDTATLIPSLQNLRLRPSYPGRIIEAYLPELPYLLSWPTLPPHTAVVHVPLRTTGPAFLPHVLLFFCACAAVSQSVKSSSLLLLLLLLLLSWPLCSLLLRDYRYYRFSTASLSPVVLHNLLLCALSSARPLAIQPVTTHHSPLTTHLLPTYSLFSPSLHYYFPLFFAHPIPQPPYKLFNYPPYIHLS